MTSRYAKHVSRVQDRTESIDKLIDELIKLKEDENMPHVDYWWMARKIGKKLTEVEE